MCDFGNCVCACGIRPEATACALVASDQLCVSDSRPSQRDCGTCFYHILGFKSFTVRPARRLCPHHGLPQPALRPAQMPRMQFCSVCLSTYTLIRHTLDALES